MNKGLWIIFENAGGELDRQYVIPGISELDILQRMVREAGELRPGDVIRIVDGDPPQF